MSFSLNTCLNEPSMSVGGETVKKTFTILIILAVTMMVFALAISNMASARASSAYSIGSVNHTLTVLYNGYVVMNDTLAISGQTDSLVLGFPHTFGSDIIESIAYDTSDVSNTFPVTQNVPLIDSNGTIHLGFYGMSIDLSKGTPHLLSVVTVFSNNILAEDNTNVTEYYLDFPAFPALTENVAVCNCSVIVPADAQYFNGTISSFNYTAQNLNAFTYNESQVGWMDQGLNIQIVQIQQLTRTVSIDPFGKVSFSDTYHILDSSSQIYSFIDIDLPVGASNVAAFDALSPFSEPSSIVVGNNITRYTVNFTLPIDPQDTKIFTVTYDVSGNTYVSRQGNSFTVGVPLFQEANTFIEQASVDFILPTGARLMNFGTNATSNLYDVNRDVQQETLTVDQQNIISWNAFSINLTYQYTSLWLSLIPTLWMWTAAVVGSVLVWSWRRPRTAVEVVASSEGLRLLPGDVRSFVDAYDEKLKIEKEVDILESKVQKGKIQRSRYKIQKKTFETRLDTLDRTLAEVGGRMHASGGHYSDLMRQLEVAETEIDEGEANISSIEARHQRGEISLDTYRKLMGDYDRRKDRARSNIDGILLRLREEI